MKKFAISIFVFFLGMVVAGLSLAEEDKISPEMAAELEMIQAEIAAKGLSFTVGYSKAMEAGAYGGKLAGAGGGGFLFVLAPKEKQPAVRQALDGLLEVSFEFENEGSKIIYLTN